MPTSSSTTPKRVFVCEARLKLLAGQSFKKIPFLSAYSHLKNDLFIVSSDSLPAKITDPKTIGSIGREEGEMVALIKEKKPMKIWRVLKTLFFLISMIASFLLFSAPVLLVITDALIPSALFSALLSPLSLQSLSSHIRNYDFRASIVDIPVISIARSIVIICVYCLCDGPGLSRGPYLAVTTLCSLLSIGFVSLKTCVLGAKMDGGRLAMMRLQEGDLSVNELWAMEAMLLCSLILAVGHVVVAYRISCRERRKLLVFKIDLEAGYDRVSAGKIRLPAYSKVMFEGRTK
ncbi:hypothetical protein ACLOJK_032267 [Asimina triloba]